MRLWGVRHGESVWNVERRVQGQAPGVPLSERGRLQALDAAAALADSGAARVLSSDLQRALETAAPIAARLGVPVEPEPALREQGLGEMEGRLARELHAEPVPSGLHINEVRWGGGESIADVFARLESFCARLRREPATSMVLVTHEGTLQVMRALLAGRGWRDIDWTPIGHAEIVAFDLDHPTHRDPSCTRGGAGRRPSTGD